MKINTFLILMAIMVVQVKLSSYFSQPFELAQQRKVQLLYFSNTTYFVENNVH